MPKTCAIVPAAGRGLRMGRNTPKQFLELQGKPILLHTLDALARAPFLSDILLVVSEELIEDVAELVEAHLLSFAPGMLQQVTFVPGGAERQESVANALEHLPVDCEWVLIHDGVRPFPSLRLIEEIWKSAQETGAAIAALPATDTIKRVGGGHVRETLRREEIWLAQTPQVFRADVILSAYRKARQRGWSGTDDASFVERLGKCVRVVEGERSNIKVTTPEDLEWAAWHLERGRN